LSIKPLEADIMVSGDETLKRFHKKINELVGASNDDFNSILAIRNDLAQALQELKDIKMRLQHT